MYNTDEKVLRFNTSNRSETCPHPDAPSCLLPSQNQLQCINTKRATICSPKEVHWDKRNIMPYPQPLRYLSWIIDRKANGKWLIPHISQEANDAREGYDVVPQEPRRGGTTLPPWGTALLFHPRRTTSPAQRTATGGRHRAHEGQRPEGVPVGKGSRAGRRVGSRRLAGAQRAVARHREPGRVKRVPRQGDKQPAKARSQGRRFLGARWTGSWAKCVRDAVVVLRSD